MSSRAGVFQRLADEGAGYVVKQKRKLTERLKLPLRLETGRIRLFPGFHP